MSEDVTIALSNDGSDLDGIIALQRENLELTVGPDDAAREVSAASSARAVPTGSTGPTGSIDKRSSGAR